MTLVPVGGDWFPLRGLWLLGSPRDRDVVHILQTPQSMCA